MRPAGAWPRQQQWDFDTGTLFSSQFAPNSITNPHQPYRLVAVVGDEEAKKPDTDRAEDSTLTCAEDLPA
jgi:hypothetical protein